MSFSLGTQRSESVPVGSNPNTSGLLILCFSLKLFLYVKKKRIIVQ